MICIYPADCTDFSSNGLGIVQPQSCTVTETLNGEWELTLVHPIDEHGRWTRLSEGNILRAPVPAAMTPQMNLVTQQYQTQTYDVEIYKVTTQRDPLRLRSGTGTRYRILGKYKKGTEVIVVNKTTSSWYEVTCPDGRHGYMSSEYLTHVRTEQQSVQVDVGFQNQVIESRQLRDQPFRIYRVAPELDKVTVYARHIFYDLLDNMIKSLKPSSSAVGASVVQSLSDACLTSHDFTFYSDLTSTAEEAEWENVNPVEALLGEGGLVEKYGAELARDWFDVFLVRRVGADSDVQIRERKNLTGISYDVDETDVVTRIMPTGEDADGNILYLPELYIDSPNLGAYTHPKWIHLAVSEAKEVAEGENYKSLTACYEDMRAAAQAEFDKGCDLPTVTLKVDFVNCADTEEYRQYAFLLNIFLGDSVRVVARRIGVEVSMRMTQYTYDCLTRKYTSVTLGTAADTLEGSMISARQLASGSITGYRDDSVTMDGTRYYYTGIAANEYSDNSFDFDEDYNVYLTEDGFVIGVDGSTGFSLSDLYYVTGVYRASGSYGGYDYYAQAVSLTDGVVEEIELDVDDEDNVLNDFNCDDDNDYFDTSVAGLYEFDDDIATAKYDDNDAIDDYTVVVGDLDESVDVDDTRINVGGRYYLDSTTQYLAVDDTGSDIEVTAATGGITAAAARQGATVLFSQLLIGAMDQLLIPLVYAYVAVSCAHAAVGNPGLERLAGLLKGAATALLTGLLLAFVGYLTASGAIAGSVDAAAVKAAKLAISRAIPVVGGVLADASESVLAGAGALRGTVGAAGLIVVLAICLGPFLRLALQYLVYKGTGALCAAVAQPRLSKLIDAIGGAFGLVLGMTGAGALILLVSLVSAMTAVTA